MATGAPPVPSLLSRLWFPVCLGLLVLLFLPGLVLLTLHLCGLSVADEVNTWAKLNFDLSYHYPPMPWWFTLLLLLAPVGVILLYFLKLKRRPLQVPSTFLWKKSIEDLHVNALFQWLRHNVLLLLQLLVLLILIYAALGLRFHGQTTTGKHYIIMIDNSASMASTDIKPSRLEWAKAEALKLIDAAAEDHLGMVIEFNSTASTLQTYTTDKGDLRRAVNSIKQTNRPTRIEDALTLADNLANQFRSTENFAMKPEDQAPENDRNMVTQKEEKATEVFLFTDAVFQEPSPAALASLNSLLSGKSNALGNLRMHFFQAGNKERNQVDNVGIVFLDAERGDPAKDDSKPRSEQNVNVKVFVEVHNFRPKETEAKLRLDVRVKGQLVHATFQQLRMEARDAKTGEPGKGWGKFEVRGLDISAGPVVEASLEDISDDFPLDDRAWLVLAPKRKAQVLVVSDGKNAALDAFFDQGPIQELATVDTLLPADLDREVYRLKAVEQVGYDLVIFDRCTPNIVKELPQANTLFIGAAPPPWTRGKKLENPKLIVSKSTHPLLRQIKTLRDVKIGEAFAFDFPEEKKPQRTNILETTGEQPLLFSVERGNYKDLVMAFALFNDQGDLVSEWPLRRSFPVFLRNALAEYGNMSLGNRTLQAGELFQFRPEPGVAWQSVQPPKGQAKALEKSGPELVFAGTDDLGVYTMTAADGKQRAFAVNLLDALESDIEPRARFKVGGETVEAEAERRQPYDLWKWFALAALAFLLLEWWIYNRRVFV